MIKINIEVMARTSCKVDNGDNFSYAGDLYFAEIHREDGAEDYYWVQDEIDLRYDRGCAHGMSKDFFDKNFDIIRRLYHEG